MESNSKKTATKRVNFKKEFKSIDEALTRIPEVLKEDNKVFELNDGNKTIKVRWEGSLQEGEAIPLSESDNKLISEDMSKMKKLMGYKSEDTIGTPTAKNRVDETTQFKSLLSNVKSAGKENEKE
jgi:hypothetical protein